MAPVQIKSDSDTKMILDKFVIMPFYFEGVMSNIERRYRETSSDYIRDQMEKYMAQQDCPTCKGYRLKPETLAVKVDSIHIGKVTEFSIQEADQFFRCACFVRKRYANRTSDFERNSRTIRFPH